MENHIAADALEAVAANFELTPRIPHHLPVWLGVKLLPVAGQHLDQFIDCLGNVACLIVVRMERPAARHDARRTIASDFELTKDFLDWE